MSCGGCRSHSDYPKGRAENPRIPARKGLGKGERRLGRLSLPDTLCMRSGLGAVQMFGDKGSTRGTALVTQLIR